MVLHLQIRRFFLQSILEEKDIFASINAKGSFAAQDCHTLSCKSANLVEVVHNVTIPSCPSP